MNSSKRKIITGGIVAVLGIALLAYVVHVLTAALARAFAPLVLSRLSKLH